MMQTFKKGNISLDKTIALSKQIAKGEVEPSSVIELNSFCGEIVSFEFKHFKNCLSVPIEHVGLAQLVYEKAIDQFSTIKVNEDGSAERIFEALPKDVHIADVLQNCEADTLAWYKDKNNNPLKFPTKFDGNYTDTDLNHFERVITSDEQDEKLYENCSDRFKAASLAICEAMATYETYLVEEGVVESSDDLSPVSVAESKAMNKNLLELRQRTVEKYGQEAQEGTEAVDNSEPTYDFVQ